MATRETVHGLFLRHSERLRGFIHALVGSHQDADDILQDVFLVVVDKSADFTEGTDFLAWVRTIARYRILHHQAAQRRRRNFDPDVVDLLCDQAGIDGDADWDREMSALRTCLDSLAPGARRIIQQRYEDDLPASEIAARSGRTVNGVSVALAKIRAALRACVERRMHAGPVGAA
jgi:RNA polymerase sigma-70 factor (ECF subfamily)